MSENRKPESAPEVRHMASIQVPTSRDRLRYYKRRRRLSEECYERLVEPGAADTEAIG